MEVEMKEVSTSLVLKLRNLTNIPKHFGIISFRQRTFYYLHQTSFNKLILAYRIFLCPIWSTNTMMIGYRYYYSKRQLLNSTDVFQVTLCLMDAEDYSALPLGQWEEDNVLRELNKSLLAFQQTPMKGRDTQKHERRLSPIGN